MVGAQKTIPAQPRPSPAEEGHCEVPPTLSGALSAARPLRECGKWRALHTAVLGGVFPRGRLMEVGLVELGLEPLFFFF